MGVTAGTALIIERPRGRSGAETAAGAGWPANLLAPDLPLDGARGSARRHPVGRVTHGLSEAILERVAELAQQNATTPHTWLLAVFVVLLSRYTRESDFLVAVPRDESGAAEPLAVRLGIDAARSFAELLAATSESVAAAATGPVEPALAFDAGPPRTGDATGDTTAVELGLCVRTLDDRADVTVAHAADLLDEASARGWARHYARLLESSLDDPGAACDGLDALGEDERRVVVEDWNRNDEPVPQPSLHRMVERHAAARPEAAAIVADGGRRLTYAQLDAQANRLAHALRSRGVGPETVVGLCLERSPDAVVAALATLKAGGAFLPLDPAYPADRLAFMVEDSAAQLLIVSPGTAMRLPPGQAERLDLEGAAAELAGLPASAPELDDDPERLAYVIYTSGSTGRPKGVLVPHRGLGNLGWSLGRGWDLRADSQHLLFASFSFDATVADLTVTFAAGGTLHLASAEAQFPGAPLLRLLEERGITSVCVPPSTLAVLGDAALPALRSVAVAGEACPPEIVERWSRGRRLSNSYGPTEATVCVSTEVCAPGGRRPSIGRPLPNVRAYVVDERLRPVPIGVPGELLVGGIGVARGYLGRPELTAERFVPSPFQPGSRLYRTGDLVRWLPDGRLDFLGRVDDQVKLRGYRVEIGEVESALAALPGVQAAAAVACGEGAHRRLAAFVACEPGIEAGTLREALRARLPEYMVPSTFERLERLPSTPNGKIDRRALRERAAAAVAPRPAAPERPAPAAGRGLEAIVAEAWSEMAGIAGAGLDDNFFELGGQSLTLVRVQQRLEQRLGRPIAITELFGFPTIRSLARHLGSGEGDAVAASAADRARQQREALARARTRPGLRR